VRSSKPSPELPTMLPLMENLPGKWSSTHLREKVIVYVPSGVTVSVGLPAEPGTGAFAVLMARCQLPTSAAGGTGAGRMRATTVSLPVCPFWAMTLTVNLWRPGVSHDVTRYPPVSLWCAYRSAGREVHWASSPNEQQPVARWSCPPVSGRCGETCANTA